MSLPLLLLCVIIVIVVSVRGCYWRSANRERDLARGAVDEAEVLATEAQAFLSGIESDLEAVWQDTNDCHRSSIAGSARAALRVEQADPQTSVTFIHLACTGGTVNAGLVGPFHADTDPLQPQVDEAAIGGDRLVERDEEGIPAALRDLERGYRLGLPEGPAGADVQHRRKP